MLSATFIFFPAAIMSARFNKGHLLRCCRVYMWFHVSWVIRLVFDSFQIHWICNFLGVASTSVAFFSIYYEAYFKVLQCSTECGDVVRGFYMIQMNIFSPLIVDPMPYMEPLLIHWFYFKHWRECVDRLLLPFSGHALIWFIPLWAIRFGCCVVSLQTVWRRTQ